MSWLHKPERLSTKRLQQWQRQYSRRVAEKEAVMARHELGTPWHTRAAREADGARSRLGEVEAELRRRGEL